MTGKGRRDQDDIERQEGDEQHSHADGFQVITPDGTVHDGGTGLQRDATPDEMKELEDINDKRNRPTDEEA